MPDLMVLPDVPGAYVSREGGDEVDILREFVGLDKDDERSVLSDVVVSRGWKWNCGLISKTCRSRMV